MLSDAQFSSVYIACGYTDLRCGIDGLAAVIRERFDLTPFNEGEVFLFCGRRNDRIKALVWDGDGFLLMYKRLEDGKFRWPRSSDELRKLTPEQFGWLMKGFSIDPGIRRIRPPERVI